MLLEAIDWLAREIVIDRSAERLIRQADKLKPGAGVVVTKVYIGTTLGATTGRIAGKQTARNVERGMPSTVGLDYTPDIQAYDRSALKSTRLI